MITAQLRHLRISPRKIRLVANLIKGLDVEEAEKQLRFLNKRAARPILKLLHSAVANAQHNANLPKEGLYISKIIVEAGPSLKRWLPRAMGRVSPIMKRTSHIILTLEPKPSLAAKKIKPIAKKEVKPTAKKEELTEGLVEKDRIQEEEKVRRLEKIVPPRPYQTSSQSKRRFFSRQTFGNVKKFFRRKSI